MSAALLTDANGAKVHHATWRELLDVVPRCDALIVDAPYSERTHAGHDGALVDDMRNGINYGFWTDADVRSFVGEWSPRTDGWMVSITDTELAPAWATAFNAVGRYAFSPVAFVAPGSRVRMSGDGPSQWSCWIMVARPRTKAMAKWGTLPGAYVLPAGCAQRQGVVGGKPLWLMERLCEDYSRPGDLIVDPCCGAGTTLLGAIRTGRRAIGGDALLDHANLAAKRIGGMQQMPLIAGGIA